MLKSNEEIVVVNDYIENDPLSENNLDKTLDLVNEFCQKMKKYEMRVKDLKEALKKQKM